MSEKLNNKHCGECLYYDAPFCDCHAMKVASTRKSCDLFDPKEKPPTNGDVIRQMSNEELVAFFITRDASYCVPDACLGDCEASKDCDDHWLRWLNAPAKEGEDEP